MGVRHKEHVHSNILAALLDPNYSHGMGYVFINLFLRALKETPIFSGIPFSLSTIIATTNTRVKITRELEHIDLVIEFPDVNVIIAIENKIWAREQPEQIQRYQSALDNRYKNYHKALVFLTPTGRNPTTANTNSLIPIYCMSYGKISWISQLAMNSAGHSANFFIGQFISHLERYMTGNSEVKELCWQLFKKHEDVYNYIAKHHEYCIARKILEYFDKISNIIENDNMFLAWRNKLEVEKKYQQDKVKFDINLRNKSWPEGIYIKIYKHGWLGIFPFVKETNKELVKKYFTKEPKPVRYWNEHYYFSNNESLDKERCVLENGNEISDSEVNSVLSKLQEFLKEIEEVLNKST